MQNACPFSDTKFSLRCEGYSFILQFYNKIAKLSLLHNNEKAGRSTSVEVNHSTLSI